jgi:hypothetical protein
LATAGPSWFEASLYSPAAKYLTNDGSFAQSQQPSPWRIEFIDGAPRNGGSIRLQAEDGRFLRSDGGEGTPPSWTEEKCEESVWILMYSAGSGELTADTAVQLKSPTGGGGEIGGHPHPCLCNDTPTGGWGGAVKGKYSWCPEGRGDAFWNLHGLSAVSGKGPDTLDAALSMLSAALSGGSSSTRLAKLSATAIELVHKADSQAIEAAVEKLLSKEGPLTARFFIDDCARAPDRPRIALASPRPLS